MKQTVQVSKHHTYTGHKDCLYTLAKFDSDRFFSAGADGMVILWDLKELNKGTILAKVPSSIYSICYSEINNVLIVGQNYDGIHLIDVVNKKEINSLKITSSAIFDIQVDLDNIYIGTGEGELVVVDYTSLTIKYRIKASDKSARSIAVNNHQVFVGYSDTTIRVFDKLQYTVVHEVAAHDNSVFRVKYDPRSRCLFSGSRDAHIKIWENETMELKEDIVAHMYAINDIEFSPDGQHFVTCSMDKAIKVWDSPTYKLKKVIDKTRHAGHGTSVNKMLWMPFNNYLVSCSDDHTISVWKINFGN